MILDSTTKSLELILGTAVTTTDMPITVDYVDLTTTTTTCGSSDSQSNGTTLVTILAAPAASTQRKVNSITVYNADSVSKLVKVRLNNNATLRSLVVITLQVGETLGYTDALGWYVQDTNGNRKSTGGSSDVGAAIAAAPNKVTPIGADKIGIWDSVSGLLNGVLFSNLNLLWAALAGSASQVFSVGTATATTHAVPLSQTVGRNKYVNGDYQVSQVNVDTAHTITAAAAINYGIDQWYTQSTGQNITAQRIAGTAPFRYAYKLSAGATGPTTTLHGQRIEGKDAAFFESGNVAVKVNIVCDVARTVTWTAYYATVEDTFSTKTQIATGSISATAVDTTFSYTFNAGANAKLGIAIEYTTGTLTNSTGYITYSGHQLESGVVSSAYEHIKYGDMLIRCQRYLPVFSSGAATAMVGSGVTNTTTNALIVISFSVPTRIAVTGVTSSAANILSIFTVASFASSAIAFNTGGFLAAAVSTTVTGATAGQGGIANLIANSTLYFTGAQL